jgi:hypothetical protein
MAAEATCVSKPWAVIPMVVTGVQDYIAAGQFRGGEQLIDAQQVSRPGTILVFLEPLYEGGLDGVIPGSSCIVNAYSSNHELLASSPDMSTTKRLVLHGWMPSGSCMPCSCGSRPWCFQSRLSFSRDIETRLPIKSRSRSRARTLAARCCPSQALSVLSCRSGCPNFFAPWSITG